jgi:hypothetical protein
VPEITDRLEAKSDPELAVLSVIAHGRDRDSSKSARIARAAQEASLGLDPERMFLYFDLILASLSEAARRELRPMKPAGYEPQSDYFRNLWTEARASGRRELVTRLLTVRFGSLPEEAQTQIAQLGIDELDAVGERLLTANSVGEALGSHWRA